MKISYYYFILISINLLFIYWLYKFVVQLLVKDKKSGKVSKLVTYKFFSFTSNFYQLLFNSNY